MSAICHDHGPHEVSEPHGPWWLTVRLPLPRDRRLYVGTGTARRWRWWRLERWSVMTPWVTVAVSKGRGSRNVSLHRWCAHVDVRYTGKDAR